VLFLKAKNRSVLANLLKLGVQVVDLVDDVDGGLGAVGWEQVRIEIVKRAQSQLDALHDLAFVTHHPYLIALIVVVEQTLKGSGFRLGREDLREGGARRTIRANAARNLLYGMQKRLGRGDELLFMNALAVKHFVGNADKREGVQELANLQLVLWWAKGLGLLWLKCSADELQTVEARLGGLKHCRGLNV
jgi:hypothetical protein